ncbi:MAG: hypothetical protein IKZ34_02290 [Alphaproteobacteria bacterium]|jgi:hypothetical protein|nr:hypothetical protein [Alphaproteobacteria bacterium]
MKKKLFFTLLLSIGCVFGASAVELSCGAGYVLVDTRDKIDGIRVAECQKLWCYDLETGKKMGSDNKANSGYIMTVDTIKLCDNSKNCVECWGDRKWCAGEAPGYWNPKYGAYTRNGDDNASYESYQKGSCFAWRLEKPQCESGQTAILQDNEWVCVTAEGGSGVSRDSSVRRTGSMKRIKL